MHARMLWENMHFFDQKKNAAAISGLALYELFGIRIQQFTPATNHSLREARVLWPRSLAILWSYHAWASPLCQLCSAASMHRRFLQKCCLRWMMGKAWIRNLGMVQDCVLKRTVAWGKLCLAHFLSRFLTVVADGSKN